MAARGKSSRVRHAPHVLDERSDMRVYAPSRASKRTDSTDLLGFGDDGGLSRVGRASCANPTNPADCANPTNRANPANPADQLVFHDGPETTYRYIELPRRRVRIMRCESVAKRLVVPSRIDGKLVTEFADGAFAGLGHVQSLTCPAGVSRVGSAAFAECGQLRHLVLPAAAIETSPTWLLGCTQLEDVALPARATSFDEDFLASFAPRRVFVGAKTRRFTVPERWFSGLDEFAIDSDNPWIKTDGTCIYSSDGEKLLSCAVHRPVVDVAPGCAEIARKAFAGNIELKSVNLPESVRSIGASAFAGSGLVEFSAGGGLREIGTRAFARCDNLARVQLAEGLEVVGEEAFAHCRKLAQVSMPKTLRDLGVRAVFDTAFQKFGGSFAPSVGARGTANAVFSDDCGVVYKRLSAGGLALLDAGALQNADYQALPETYEVAPRAFYRHPALQSIAFAEGLHVIGRLAFAECPNLTEARLPDSLRSIGERAFCGSALASFTVPASLDYLGERALGIVSGGRPDEVAPLRECRVAQGNGHFFMHDGLLCERTPAGVRVVLYVGPETKVSLPAETYEVAPFAFAGVRGISRLQIPCSVERVGIAAFAVAQPCDVVEFRRARRWRGQDAVEVRPPADISGALAMRGGLVRPPLAARTFSDACDQAVFTSRSVLARGRYMVWRLQNPLYLDRGVRKRYENELRTGIVPVCRAFFKADERVGLSALGALGFLPEEVLSWVIDAAQGWNNVSCMALLLSMKHENFGHANDFDL